MHRISGADVHMMGTRRFFAVAAIMLSALLFPYSTGLAICNDNLWQDPTASPLLSPPEVWVDDDYYDGGYNDGHTWAYDAFDNIQDGIDAVAATGIVHVNNGTYAEGAQITKGLKLVGEDQTQTCLVGSTPIVLVNTAAPVEIVNLNLGADGGASTGIKVNPGANATIRNNIITEIYIGIEASGLVHIDSNFYEYTSTVGWSPHGISLESGTDYNSTVTNNTIHFYDRGHGIRMGACVISLIEGNRIESDIDATPSLPSGVSGGIVLYEFYPAVPDTTRPVVVRNNYVRTLDWGVVAEAVSKGIIENNSFVDVDIGIASVAKPGTDRGSYLVALHNTLDTIETFGLVASSYSRLIAIGDTIKNAKRYDDWGGFGGYVRYTGAKAHFERCYFLDNMEGIKTYPGCSTVVYNNTFKGSGLAYYSHGNDLIECNIFDSNVKAVQLINLVGQSAEHTVIGNTMLGGTWGMWLANVHDMEVTGNTIQDNMYGIEFEGWGNCENNVIYHNNFISNGIQVIDPIPEVKYWHHPALLEGNYWSDYTGLDDGSGGRIAGDGIGDTEIPHPTTGFDLYPFMERHDWASCGAAGAVTGGGWIPGDRDVKGGKRTFGLEARSEDGIVWGELVFQDHASRMTVHAEAVHTLVLGGNSSAEFSGLCRVDKVSGYSFQCEVEDNGEPGRGRDEFGISIRDFDGDLFYVASGVLGGGNIQIYTEEDEDLARVRPTPAEPEAQDSDPEGSVQLAQAVGRTQFALYQNTPNPFRNQTEISYMLPASARVTLEVFDIGGRAIQVLVDEVQQSGNHQVSWDAGHAPAGMYFYRLSAGDFSDMKKTILVR